MSLHVLHVFMLIFLFVYICSNYNLNMDFHIIRRMYSVNGIEWNYLRSVLKLNEINEEDALLDVIKHSPTFAMTHWTISFFVKTQTA